MKRVKWVAFLAILMLIFACGNGNQPAGETVTTETGLQIIDREVGDGEMPKTGDIVRVHYTGKLDDGTVFDSSVERGVPIEFPLGKGGVIKGWDEGIATMKVGGKRTLIIPPDLAYGNRKMGDVIPANSTLTFDVELVEIVDPNAPIPAPDFTLYDLNGEAVKLSDFAGKTVLMNIWATWCPPCKKELPDLVKIMNEFGGENFTILGLAVENTRGSDFAGLKKFAKDKKLNYPILTGKIWQESGKKGRNAEVDAAIAPFRPGNSIPTTFIIDKDGNICEKIVGMRDYKTFKELVEKWM